MLTRRIWFAFGFGFRKKVNFPKRVGVPPGDITDYSDSRSTHSLEIALVQLQMTVLSTPASHIVAAHGCLSVQKARRLRRTCAGASVRSSYGEA